MQITVRGDRATASAEELVADYKYRGINVHKAWDEFVKDRSLRPEINKPKLSAIYATVSPVSLDEVVDVPFTPTHYSALFGFTQIKKNAGGWFEILFEGGTTGTNPAQYHEDWLKTTGMKEVSD